MRRLMAGAAIAASTVFGVAGFDVGVDAGSGTSSSMIAGEAGRALHALDAWEADRSPANYVRFVRSRDHAATMTAVDLEIDPAELREAWASVPRAKQHAVLAAMSQLGVPYKRIAAEPGVGFDCSGLTLWAYAEAGIEIPRVSRDQIDAAEPVGADSVEAGDLMHYPGHIGMYLGAGLFVHSPEPGTTVTARPLPSRSHTFGSVTDD